MNRGAFERLFEGEWREDPRQSLRHHRLAAAGRTDQEQVVAARGRDFEGAPGQKLAANVREIGRGDRGRGRRLRAWKHVNCLGMVQGAERFAQRPHGAHF
jgi:hypothetical protein